MINEAEQQGVDIGPLQDVLDGWELLLDEFPWDEGQFDHYAAKRGEGIFGFARGVAGELTDSQRQLAQAWALWDFARHCSDTNMRERAFEKCRAIYRQAESVRFDRSGRPLSYFL